MQGWKDAARGAFAALLCLAVPAEGQIVLTEANGRILSGESQSDSASTTIVTQGQLVISPAQNTATTFIGFNVNADAAPGLVAAEIGIASFDVGFIVDHPASFDLTLDFLLHGQLLRLEDQQCQGSIALADIAIAKLVRLPDGAEFPLDVVLPGASLDLDAGNSSFNFAEQDSRVIEIRGDPIESSTYRLSFTVSVTAISQSCEVSGRFGADNGSTTGCDACVYPGFGDRVRDEDGLFVTVTVTSLCGNQRLDPGEQCDFGPQNGARESCCDAFCLLAPATKVCRPAAGECDQSETCSGTSGGCPLDLFKPAGAPCTADNDACSDDVCDESAACTHPLRAGTTCDAQNQCTCDDDGLFCTGPVRCPAGGGLCLRLPPPCGEDDTCDEQRDICVSPFGTATPTSTPSPAPTGATPTPSTPGAICVGDCNADRAVAVNELVLGVNIALGNQLASACPAVDVDRSGTVAINELVAAVANALAGCRI